MHLLTDIDIFDTTAYVVTLGLSGDFMCYYLFLIFITFHRVFH